MTILEFEWLIGAARLEHVNRTTAALIVDASGVFVVSASSPWKSGRAIVVQRIL